MGREHKDGIQGAPGGFLRVLIKSKPQALMVMPKSHQVGIASDHFPTKSRSTDRRACISIGVPLMSRIRHCVECPKCLTRYLVAFSPYGNGSYLVPARQDSSEEYALYCCCGGFPIVNSWKWREAKACAVSLEAYERGYGTPEEIFPVTDQSAWSFDFFPHLAAKPMQKGRHPR